MRLIAIGDDDQSIYEFKGISPKLFCSLIRGFDAVKYEMTGNLRSRDSIVALSNDFDTPFRTE